MAGSIALVLLSGLAPGSRACQICLPLPTESLADRILASEHLVLARENPDQPYTLQATRVLKEGASKAPPIDLFLDSSTRRLLSLDPNLGVLCGWSPEQGEWRRLTLHEAAVVPVVEAILTRAASWREDPGKRVRYFAGFLGHEHSTLSDLAHIEVARAPYSQLVHYADRIPREGLYERLANYRRMEWHALYILFLARSEDPRDHEFIRRNLEDAAHYRLALQAAAWATALIEIDGPAGVERLRELYLEDPERSPKEIEAIHSALRVHGDEGQPELRDKLVEAYGKPLQRQPELAADLADDLTRWQRFDHADAFAALLAESPPDLAATARIRNHLRAGGPATSPPPPAEPTGMGPVLAAAGGLLLIPLLLALHGRHKTPRTA